MIEKEKTQKYIRKVRIIFDQYEKALMSLLSLKKIIENKYSGQFYFGGSLTPTGENKNVKTPDIISIINNFFIIGDLKRSLRAKIRNEKDEHYIKKYIEEKIFNQLKKYDSPFKEVSEKHDIILVVPRIDTEAVSFIKFDYLTQLIKYYKFYLNIFKN